MIGNVLKGRTGIITGMKNKWTWTLKLKKWKELEEMNLIFWPYYKIKDVIELFKLKNIKTKK